LSLYTMSKMDTVPKASSFILSVYKYTLCKELSQGEMQRILK